MFGFDKTNQEYKLDYLFIAETFNGNILRQPSNDKPKYQEIGSSFTEVLKEKIKRFSLIGKGHIFTVDLTDGHFEVDGRKLYPPSEIHPGVKFELIYYRQVQQRLKDDLLGNKSLEPIVRYFIGWQYLHNGKNHQWTMGVD